MFSHYVKHPAEECIHAVTERSRSAGITVTELVEVTGLRLLTLPPSSRLGGTGSSLKIKGRGEVTISAVTEPAEVRSLNNLAHFTTDCTGFTD